MATTHRAVSEWFTSFKLLVYESLTTVEVDDRKWFIWTHRPQRLERFKNATRQIASLCIDHGINPDDLLEFAENAWIEPIGGGVAGVTVREGNVCWARVEKLNLMLTAAGSKTKKKVGRPIDAVVQERRAEVNRLIQKGYGPGDIAAELNVSVDLVKKDKGRLKT